LGLFCLPLVGIAVTGEFFGSEDAQLIEALVLEAEKSGMSLSEIQSYEGIIMQDDVGNVVPNKDTLRMSVAIGVLLLIFVSLLFSLKRREKCMPRGPFSSTLRGGVA